MEVSQDTSATINNTLKDNQGEWLANQGGMSYIQDFMFSAEINGKKNWRNDNRIHEVLKKSRA